MEEVVLSMEAAAFPWAAPCPVEEAPAGGPYLEVGVRGAGPFLAAVGLKNKWGFTNCEIQLFSC